MEDKNSSKKLTADNIIKFLIIFMILFVTYIIVASILRSDYDYNGMIVGTIFIFVLLLLKWLVKEVGIE